MITAMAERFISNESQKIPESQGIQKVELERISGEIYVNGKKTGMVLGDGKLQFSTITTIVWFLCIFEDIETFQIIDELDGSNLPIREIFDQLSQGKSIMVPA